MNTRRLTAAIALSLCVATASAADLQLRNMDVPGVGLNDATPAAPVGGNTATTVGGQRLRVYQYAMSTFGSVLGSNAPVLIEASFPALSCTATSATLGSAGPIWLASDGTQWIHGALGNALTESDLDPTRAEIRARFNPNLGSPTCLSGSGWYYGLDGNTPAGKINFLNVVMHEIAHGLGVSGFLDKTTGAFFSGLPDVYTAKARSNIAGRSFVDPAMTNTDRAIAMRTVGATVWTGVNVNQQAALLLDDGYQEHQLRVTAPAGIARSYGYADAAFGPAATPANFNGEWVPALDAADAAGPLTSDACSAITNPAAVAGKIAIVERGTCGFAVKVKNAQNAGAIAVVVVNSAAGAWGTMGGADPTITIPSVQVLRPDGLSFIANAPVTGGLVALPVTKYGMDVNGRTRLYSPWVVAPGSTFSHLDTVVRPDALMEPFDTPSIKANLSLDLTPALLRDVGWPMNDGNAMISSPSVPACDSGIDAVSDGGLVIGASVTAASDMCLATARTRWQYYSCMQGVRDRMVASGLITSTQGSKMLMCARRITDHQTFPIAP